MCVCVCVCVFVCVCVKLNKANKPDTPAAFLNLGLSIDNGEFLLNIYNKRDDFDFSIVNFPFLGGNGPRDLSYGINISQLIRFPKACSSVWQF